MHKPTAFPLLGDTQHIVLNLSLDHAPQVQELCEASADFNWLVEGEPVSPQAGEAIFLDLPPGREHADKFVFGVFDDHGSLCAVMEGIRDYPDEGVWWIGLLLLRPGSRGSGLGRRLLDGFADYVRAQQGEALMLGVVEANTEGLRFWQRLGFAEVRRTEPRTFGSKSHVVSVMRLRL